MPKMVVVSLLRLNCSLVSRKSERVWEKLHLYMVKFYLAFHLAWT